MPVSGTQDPLINFGRTVGVPRKLGDRSSLRTHSTGPAEPWAMMVNDVKRAYFHAKIRTPLFVELPAEDRDEEDDARDNVG